MDLKAISDHLKNNRTLFIFTTLFSLLILYLSYRFGLDYNNYLVIFNPDTKLSYFAPNQPEPLTVFIANNIGMHIDANILIYIYIFIAIGVKVLAIKRMHYFFVPLFLYLLTYSALLEMTQLRAAVGIGCVVLSLQLYFEKKFKVALLLFLVSILFHLSMVVCALLLLNKRFLIYICILLLLFIITLSNSSVTSLQNNFPEFANIIRINSLAVHLQTPVPVNAINSRTILFFVISIPIILNWLPNNIRPLLIKTLIVLCTTTIGLFFAPGLFFRISDLFFVIAVIFTLGYCDRTSWYNKLLVIFSIFQFFITYRFIVN
jgi:hypothetical protein